MSTASTSLTSLSRCSQMPLSTTQRHPTSTWPTSTRSSSPAPTARPRRASMPPAPGASATMAFLCSLPPHGRAMGSATTWTTARLRLTFPSTPKAWSSTVMGPSGCLTSMGRMSGSWTRMAPLSRPSGLRRLSSPSGTGVIRFRRIHRRFGRIRMMMMCLLRIIQLEGTITMVGFFTWSI